jgi:uncharacterized protein
MEVVETAPLLVDPVAVLAGEEGSNRDVLRDPSRPPGAVPLAARHRGLGPVQRLRRDLDVEPRVVRECEPSVATTFERDDTAQLREQRAEAVGAALGVPDRVDQLVSADEAGAVDGQVREGDPSLASGQLVLDAPAINACDEAPTELNPRLGQDFAKVTASGIADNRGMAKLLINITHGPESPTRAALGFLVGRAALEEGHEVSFFLAGDAVHLLREPVLDGLVGLGTGSLRESYDAIVEQSGRFYVSGNSSKTRGFEPDGRAESALPARLVQLAFESDRVLTY